LHGKKLLAGAATAAAMGAAVIGISVSAASSGNAAAPGSSVAATAAVASGAATTTPIKHVVVLFDENISFDHYFGTYPFAQNQPGEPQFTAKPNTPTVNGLNSTLLDANPNLNNPQRLSPNQALTCDMNHGYTAEQQAFDGGLMDQFVQKVTGSGCTQSSDPNQGNYGPNGIDMDYYDGNTVTGLWNYAQNYTLNDNSYDTQFGPSSPGAINVISGNTHGAVSEPVNGAPNTNVANGTLFGDAEPFYDECSNASPTTPLTGTLPNSNVAAPGGSTAELTGANIGDLLNRNGLTWGWFQGGFTPSSFNNGAPVCGTTHNNIGNSPSADYSEHHEPFQYYQSTSNPLHVSPSSVAQVGVSDPSTTPLDHAVNHQYDLTWFNDAVKSGDMPAVSYLKAPEYEDGHAGYSDPLDEQRFLVDEINSIEQSPDWSSTAIFIAYDDSDGWYDHQMGPIIRASNDVNDALNGPGKCGTVKLTSGGAPVDPTTIDRCGVGPRLPLLVISPWAKQNFVDNTFTEQASIPKFIEQNWNLGGIGGESADQSSGTLMNAFDFSKGYGQAPEVILNDTTGEVVKTIPAKKPQTTPTNQPATPAATTTSTTSSTGSSSAGTSGSSSSSAGSAGSAGSSSSTPTHGVTAQKVTLPRLTLKFRSNAKVIRIVAHTKGGSKVVTSLRMRLQHGHSLIANKGARVRNHKATFTVKRGKNARSGKYKVTVTIDAGGAVAAKTESLSIR
jgi:phospholipase C